MSALCHKRTFGTAAETALFDHLVGATEKGQWYVETKCLAVFTLIIKLNLVACITGKSLGTSPLRIRPA